MARPTIDLLEDFDWQPTAAGRYTHPLHPGWEVMLLTRGWAFLDSHNRAKRSGFYQDTVVLAKYLETLNAHEIRRIAA